MKDLICSNVNCKRYLGQAEIVVADILCAGCKGSTQFKILSNNVTKLYNYKFAEPPREPKKKEDSKVITNEDAEALKPEVS